MNTKKLAILISILVVVVMVVVLASTVFTLKTISFNFLNQRNILANSTNDDYLVDVSVPYGDSIFLINKKDLTAKLEKENPYLQVVSIETTFPNNLVIHAGEREETFAIKLNNDTYAITDKSLKILKFCDFAYLTRDGYLAPIIVDIQYDDIDLVAENYELCSFINDNNIKPILNNLVYAFNKSGYNITSLKGFATNIVLRESGSFISNEEGVYDLSFVKTIEIETKYGIKISINNAIEDLPNKLGLGLSVYELQHDSHNTTGEILVFEKNNEPSAIYRQ